ncbi:hypothetical protein [Flavobacterium sp.]|uniref:hypothetical protein n=1 Tax=Flavobacterium sp. TaxID=239 RepID=UPI002602F236|nr:hypothetical protein [Flavobacterium sp.]
MMYNRFLHIAFILFGCYKLIFSEEKEDALIYFGIAPAFDPFDTKQAWNEKPVWQKAILLLEVTTAMTLIVLSLINFFK